MDNIAAQIAVVKDRLSRLDQERAEIIERLSALEHALDGEAAKQPPNAVPPVTMTSPTAEKIKLFRSLFRGREEVFPRRWENRKTGKAGYLKAAGFEIVGGRGAGAENSICHALPSDFWYDATIACRNDRADAYFITCTNVRAMGAIERLEKDLGKPVITSNQALLWHALRTAGIRDAIGGLGSLLRIGDSQYARAAA